MNKIKLAKMRNQKPCLNGVLSLLLLFILLSASCQSALAQDEQSELERITAAAERGDPKAQVRLGERYAQGKGVAKDLTKARYWYAEAAEQGDRAGQHNLGIYYAHGLGGERDLEKARYWFIQAAVQGLAFSQAELGQMYFEGAGGGETTKKH